MISFNKLPTPLTILMFVILLATMATWLIPAGRYDSLVYSQGVYLLAKEDTTVRLPANQHTLDSLGIPVAHEKFAQGDIKKAVSVPGSYSSLPSNGQSFVDILKAPLQELYDTVDIVVFILVIGGFIHVFYSTGAMEQGLTALSSRMKGRENWLIIVLTFLFALGGASFGMAEESLVFYPILIPLFRAAGYNIVIPVAVIHGGNTLGYLSSFSNPFSTIIASNAAGISWTDGINGRLAILVVCSLIYVSYMVRYANKNRSVLTLNSIDAAAQPGKVATSERMQPKAQLLLVIFGATFGALIVGVLFFDWWLLEMSSLFLFSSLVVALIGRIKESDFVRKFIKGAEEVLGVGFIIGAARGVTIILEAGRVSDTILFQSLRLIQDIPPSLFVVGLLLMFMLLTLIIPSSSGMAVLTMPILGSLAIASGLEGRTIVNAYLFGMGIMSFITPTGLMLPSLALAGLDLRSWLRFIFPILIAFFFVSVIILLVG